MGNITDRLDYPLTDFDNQVIVGKSENGIPKKAGGTTYTMFEGMIVTGYGQAEASTVILMDGDNPLHTPLGPLVRGEGGKNVDEPLALGDPLKVIALGEDTSFWVPIAPAAGPIPIDAGDVIICAGTTYAGYGKKLSDTLLTGGTTYPIAFKKIGIAKHGDNMTDGATKVRWVRVKG